MQKLTIYLFLTLFIVPNIFAVYSEYTAYGGDDNLFNGGYGFWTSTLTGEDYNPVASGNYYAYIPLVADLDNDGVKEIITLEAGEVVIRQSEDLTFKDSIPYVINEVYSWKDKRSEVMQIYDYDGDGYEEIILALPYNVSVYMYQWNGTNNTITQEKFYTYCYSCGQAQHRSGDVSINCNDVDGCSIIHLKEEGSASTPTRDLDILGYWFNSTELIQTEIYNQADFVQYSRGCFPKDNFIMSGDIDNDNIEEYVFNLYTYYDNTGYIWTTSVSLNSTKHFIIDDYTTFEIGHNGGTNYNCDDPLYNTSFIMTSPVIKDFDGNPNTLETVYAYNTADYTVPDAITKEYQIILLDKNLDEIDTYPEIDTAEGTIISNIITGDFLADTPDNDFCVVAFAKPEYNNRLEMLCANPSLNGYFGLYDHLIYTGYGNWNISTIENNNYVSLVHAVEVDNTKTNGQNLREVLTTYGTFYLNEDSCGAILPYCDLEELYTFSIQDLTVIPVDYEDINRFDIIGIKDGQLIYINDDYDNREPQFTSDILIDPCYAPSIWEINTTVKATFSVSDYEGDTIYYYATLYYGEGNRTQNTTVYTASSGDTVYIYPYTLFANVTTSLSYLTINLYDGAINNGVVTETIPFTVSTSGYEYGDGQECYFGVTLPSDNTSVIGNGCVDNNDCGSGYICKSNICQEYTEEDLVNILLPPDRVPEKLKPLIGFIIIIAVVFLTTNVLSSQGYTTGSTTQYIAAFMGFSAWIVMIIFGLISAWTVIILLILSAAVLGFKFMREG